MRLLALDLGDRWVGIAISDGLGITCRPYKTVAAASLNEELTTIFKKEGITTVVVGEPRTMRGTESYQTKKNAAWFEGLKQKFPSLEWALWDERLTSQQAEDMIPGSKRMGTGKAKVHAVAAALILSSYLDHIRLQGISK